MSTYAHDIGVCEVLSSIAKRLEKQADVAKAMAAEAWHELAERMNDEGLEGVRRGGYNYAPYVSTSAVVQDKEAFVAWAREHAPELITGTPRKALINERVNTALDAGQPLPPGLGFYPDPKISRRKT